LHVWEKISPDSAPDAISANENACCALLTVSEGKGNPGFVLRNNVGKLSIVDNFYTRFCYHSPQIVQRSLTEDSEAITTIFLGITKLVRVYKLEFVVAECSGAKVPPISLDSIVESDGVKRAKSVR
jgi:hypothetical protein